jgi:hypothetical protein
MGGIGRVVFRRRRSPSRSVVVVSAALIAFLGFSSSALASDASVEKEANGTYVLKYVADPGEANNVTISRGCSDTCVANYDWLEISDPRRADRGMVAHLPPAVELRRHQSMGLRRRHERHPGTLPYGRPKHRSRGCRSRRFERPVLDASRHTVIRAGR